MSKLFSINSLALTFAVTASLALAASANAQTSDAPISVAVRYADLNIANPAGAAVLLQRIRSAAVRACGGAPDIRLLDRRVAFDECRKAAIAAAVGQVNSPLLASMAARRSETIRIAGR